MPIGFGPPRIVKPAGRPAWNTGHPYYPYILFGVFFTEGAGTPHVLTGPARGANAAQFATAGFTWTRTPQGPVAGFPGSGTNALATPNQAVFSGLAQITALARFSIDPAHTANPADVARKDGEFTPFQLHGGGTQLATTTWTSVTGFASNSGLTLAGGTVYDAFASYDGANVVAGIWGLGSFSYAASGTIAADAGTPFILGNNESGAELFAGDLHYVLFLSRGFSQAQLSWARLNPYSVLAVAEAPLFAGRVVCTASLAGTLAALTGSAGGIALIQGAAAAPLDPLTGAAAAAVPAEGISAGILDALGGTAAAGVVAQASAAATLAPLTASAAGDVTTRAAADATLAALAATAAAAVLDEAAADATLAPLVGSAAGAAVIQVIADATLGPSIGSAAGQVVVAAGLSAALAPLIGIAAGQATITAAGNAALETLTAAAAGTVGDAGAVAAVVQVALASAAGRAMGQVVSAMLRSAGSLVGPPDKRRLLGPVDRVRLVSPPARRRLAKD